MVDPEQLHKTWAKISRLVIKHPVFDVAYQQLKDALIFNQQTGMSKNYYVVGPTGTGKSTLKDKLVTEYPSVEKNHRELVTVLPINIPALPTIKNLAEEILVQLGDPAYHKGSATEKTTRILHLVKEKEVRLIIFDEMQHFVDRGHKRAITDVADWLKTLIDRAKVSTVVMGLERTQVIMDANEQLRRRFCRRIDLEPFNLDCSISHCNFLGVIKQIDRCLGLPTPLDLQQPYIDKQLYFATNGIMDYIVKLMLGAYQIALEENHQSINRQCLEQAFSQHIWVEGEGNMNPFHAKFVWQRLDKRGMVFYQATAPALNEERGKL